MNALPRPYWGHSEVNGKHRYAVDVWLDDRTEPLTVVGERFANPAQALADAYAKAAQALSQQAA